MPSEELRRRWLSVILLGALLCLTLAILGALS